MLVCNIFCITFERTTVIVRQWVVTVDFHGLVIRKFIPQSLKHVSAVIYADLSLCTISAKSPWNTY